MIMYKFINPYFCTCLSNSSLDLKEEKYSLVFFSFSLFLSLQRNFHTILDVTNEYSSGMVKEQHLAELSAVGY